MVQGAKGVLTEFKDFISRGNVVDLAVAVVIGGAFGAVVTALVADILTPFIAAIFGKPNFSNLKFTINHSTFLYGSFINAVISFIFIAAAIFFFVIKPLNMLAERRKARIAAGEPVTESAELSDEAQLLTEIRDLLRDGRSGGPGRGASSQG